MLSGSRKKRDKENDKSAGLWVPGSEPAANEPEGIDGLFTNFYVLLVW